jgi:NADH dehydrogenase
VILLTGATGNVGSALLRRLTAEGARVRCLVRDPRRLGTDRVRVQIALGDLSDPGSFRNAMRGVKTVVHLAAAIRDQRFGSIEELNGVATLRLVQAAERAGAERFMFFSALGARPHSSTRFFRAKALAEQAVEDSGVPSSIFLPSIVYAPGDPWIRLLERMSLLPAVPVSGPGEARFQPIWTEDAADCVLNALDREPAAPHERFEIVGPEVVTYNGMVREVLRAHHRRRRLFHVPRPIVRASLDVLGAVAGNSAFATWEEAKLMDVPMVTPRGTADVESLGVTPSAMRAVLAAR